MEMDALLHLQYHWWATEQLFNSVKQLPKEELEKDRATAHGSIKSTLVHIYRADNVWFSRVSGEPFGSINDVPVPNSLAELETEWRTLLQRFQNWFRQLQPNQYGIEVRYTNSQGDPFSTPLWQIALHLVNHGTLHRGQIMAMLRQAGTKPPSTDLIFFYRALEAQKTAAS